MARRISPVLIALVAALCLTSCGFSAAPSGRSGALRLKTPASARKQVALSDAIVPAPEIERPSGICGMTRPLKVSVPLDNGSIAVADQTLTIDCPMIPALEAWLNAIVESDAQTRFGQRVATVKVFWLAYSCRGIDNMPGARLSEHAFGNAVDVAGFTLADGREIDFVRDWKTTDTQEAAFLHEVHAEACQYFTGHRLRVLARTCSTTTTSASRSRQLHGSTDTGPRRICKPTPAPDLLPAPQPRDGLPPAPDIEEPLDIAHLSTPDAVAAPQDAAPQDAAPGPGDGPGRLALPPGADRRERSCAADPAGRRLPHGRQEPDVVDPRPTTIRARSQPAQPKTSTPRASGEGFK